eukprot:TRINITY_DN9076_c0_g1_i1.p1 TRINITY_DN9076_c0_g1~~TRINITY_DN9076_c0_g1_i1.p1  ORF type:complete len:115 (-),score=24.14 TRINITY_DN9076_c0_g1_i1:185-529(-)
MGRLQRLVHLANLPLKLILPESRENITQVAFRTIPSATKIEIRRVLESLYGLEIAKVDTLNMEGKKKRTPSGFVRRPDYKKAYVTLKEPVTLSNKLFPYPQIEELKKQSKKGKR